MIVYVTSAQKHAAQILIKRSQITGREISSSITKIANAKLLLRHKQDILK